jgi:hypothetical protein
MGSSGQKLVGLVLRVAGKATKAPISWPSSACTNQASQASAHCKRYISATSDTSATPAASAQKAVPHTTLGNIKSALAGTYHHVSQKHAQRYLASFAWRFNRRYHLDTMTERLMWAALQAKPRPYRVVIVG